MVAYKKHSKEREVRMSGKDRWNQCNACWGHGFTASTTGSRWCTFSQRPNGLHPNGYISDTLRLQVFSSLTIHGNPHSSTHSKTRVTRAPPHFGHYKQSILMTLWYAALTTSKRRKSGWVTLCASFVDLVIQDKRATMLTLLTWFGIRVRGHTDAVVFWSSALQRTTTMTVRD